jgi:hypothetical protein
MSGVIKVGNKTAFVICDEKDGKCTQCGAEEETRPYGPNFSEICFDCAMQDEDGTTQRMHIVMSGENYPDIKERPLNGPGIKH